MLFLGAGVSMGAGVQSSQGLLDALLVAAPHAARVDAAALRKLDVRDQAQIIRGLYPSGDDYLAALQSELVAHPRYSLTHGLLAGLGTTENVTTNYDRLFEVATCTAGRTCRVLPYDRAAAGERWLLKLHGSIDHPSDMVLTRGDYLALPGRAGALFGLLQALLMTKHMVFVGYSLTDDSFHRVMHDVRQVIGTEHRGQKIGTAFVLFSDPLQEHLSGDVLHIVPMLDRAPDGRPLPIESAARELDLVLDEIALRSADAAAFLLDQSYETLLESDELELRDALLAARRTAQLGTTPIHEQVLEALGAFDAPT